MKKIILISITLSVIILAAVFTISHTSAPKDSLLMENVAALANEVVGDGEGGTAFCHNPLGTDEPAWIHECTRPCKGAMRPSGGTLQNCGSI